MPTEGSNWPPFFDQEVDRDTCGAPALFQEHYDGPPIPTYAQEAQAYYAEQAQRRREEEPYSGIMALFNGDLHKAGPDYCPRQDWVIVRDSVTGKFILELIKDEPTD